MSNTPPSPTRIRLAHALGHDNYPTEKVVEPYLDYIVNHHVGTGSLGGYLELFIHVIEHFQTKQPSTTANTIQALIDELALSGFRDVFSDTQSGDDRREVHVQDTIMHILGLWTTMSGSFRQHSNTRSVIKAYDALSGQRTVSSSAYK
jgi:hypothetical protein